MLKKVLAIVGGVAVLAGIAFGGWYYMTFKDSGTWAKESEQFADATVRAVVANWDYIELEKRGSPEFKATVSKGGLQKLMAMFKQRLGALKEYQGLDDESEVMRQVDLGLVTANYSARATFEHGPATIRMQLVKRDGATWQLSAFRVRSQALLEAPAEQATGEPAKPAAAPAQPEPKFEAKKAEPTPEPKAAPKPVPSADSKPRAAPAPAKTPAPIVAQPAAEKPAAKATKKAVAPVAAPGPPRPLGQADSGCVYKPVMTDEEIARCR